jgi:Holliday junction resolvasome RuvABC endonuclease subunit
MATVIGLDLSLTGTGICYPDGSTLTVKTRQDDGDARLLQIAEAVGIVLGSWDVDLAVIEDLPTHAYAAGITGMVHGVVRSELIQAGVPYALVVPSTLKAYATGKGSGDKTPMALAAFKRAGVEFADDNQCDAWWLRAAGLEWLGEPLFELPAVQREALVGVNRKGKPKVKWPEMPKAVA